MTKLILYLLESSTVLVVLYLLYLVLLRKETFFSLNRFFLLAILAFSFLFPLLSFDLSPLKDSPIDKPIEKLVDLRMSYYDALEAWTYEGLNNSSVQTIAEGNSANEKLDIKSLILAISLAIYGIGLIAMVFRLIWTFSWVHGLKNSNPKIEIQGVSVVKVSHQVAPFSFLKYLFVHEDMVDREEFAQILAHEKTHIQQRHSIDLIFVQLLAAGLWFNPAVWLLIKSLKTTHEYIADRKMVNQGYSLVEYQTLLLRQLISNNSYGLVHNFNLSFIKKRIIMMKIKESGWAGKAKVAVVLFAFVVISSVIVQCNSSVEDQVALETEASSTIEFTDGIKLPVLPKSAYMANFDLTDALNFSINGNRLTIEGKQYELNDIAPLIDKLGFSSKGAVAMRIDHTQTMAFVQDVFWELRKADHRKLLYLGQTNSGDQLEVAFLLPPGPGAEVQQPVVNEKYVTENNLDLLTIDLGDNERAINQQKVYDLVIKHLENQSSKYVVSARYHDNDTYNDYLVNLLYIQEAFNQIYEERAQKMFGRSFWEINESRSTNEESKKEYMAVRNGVPMNISVSNE